MTEILTPPPSPEVSSPQAPPPSKRPAALAVGAGIFLSRIAGLVRERIFAYYLGNSDAAGAFRAALRIPNLLQNLFGEGVLSASFIPSYARLLAEGKTEQAGRVAGVILSALTLVMAIFVVLGVTFTRSLIEILAPGFQGEVRELTIQLVRIMFPGVGLLVLSAWCLGILNSHRRFFLSYVAPVLWNIAFITTLVVFGKTATSHGGQSHLAILVAWGSVVGAGLQLLVQVPLALRLNGGLAPSLNLRLPVVRTIIKNFFPVLLARGVVQLSAYIDQVLASYLGPAAVSAMAYSQTIYLLPISLFGMSISSSELTEMSRTVGTEVEIAASVSTRLIAGLRRLSFFIVPSSVAFVLLGDVVAATLFQTGKFGRHDVHFVWLILVGGAVGLLATTQSRLCVSAFWALGDTKTPARFAALRVLATGILGYLAVFPLRTAYEWDSSFSAAMLTASAGVSGWLEYLLIRRALRKRIGRFDPAFGPIARCWGGALSAAVMARLLRLPFSTLPPWLGGAAVLGLYGTFYVTFMVRLGSEEAQAFWRMVLRRIGRG